MSTNYAGSPDTPAATIPIPDDGDAPDAASVGTPMESLMDYCVYLDARVPGVAATVGNSSSDFAFTVHNYRVPTLTGNRVYTFAAGTPDGAPDGVRVRFTRVLGSSNTATIRRSDTTTLAVMAATNQSWVEFEWSAVASDWVVSAWGGDVGSLLAEN